MENYEQHGLTRLEDDILGAFGMAATIEEEELNQEQFTPEKREAAKSLMRKGLLSRTLRDDDAIVYKLTPKGVRLWHERATEETQGLPKRSRNVSTANISRDNILGGL